MESRAKPYKSVAWKRIRETVLAHDKFICQRCAGNYMHPEGMPKRHSKAVLVHHHYKVEEYPEYKYQMYIKREDGTKVRNLWSLCSACHEYIHSDTHYYKNPYKKMLQNDEFTTEERWD